MYRLLILYLMIFFTDIAHAQGEVDIYFVRHAETVMNATGEKNSGNRNVFSERGVAEVNVLTKQLREYHFDAILVSPTQRTLNTILPYLKETGQKAEIWPELTECCWQNNHDFAEKGRLQLGTPIEIRPEEVPYFTFRDDNSRFNYLNSNYADGLAQVHHAVDLLKQHYYGTGKTILIVGHYHSGQVLLADLLGVTRYHIPDLKNAKLTHLRQENDGSFTLLSINNEETSF